MAHQTASQRLAEARDAYHRIVLYEVAVETIDGVSFTYHDLDKLRAYIDFLKAEIGTEGGRRSRNFSTFGRPQ